MNGRAIKRLLSIRIARETGKDRTTGFLRGLQLHVYSVKRHGEAYSVQSVPKAPIRQVRVLKHFPLPLSIRTRPHLPIQPARHARREAGLARRSNITSIVDEIQTGSEIRMRLRMQRRQVVCYGRGQDTLAACAWSDSVHGAPGPRIRRV